jgi:hypothetical protein
MNDENESAAKDKQVENNSQIQSWVLEHAKLLLSLVQAPSEGKR